MANVKYTKEVLEERVKDVTSFSDLARSFGLVAVGSTVVMLSRRCKQFGVDTSHFTGKPFEPGQPSRQKLHHNEVLVKRDPCKGRCSISQLRRALLESGVSYSCAECGNIGYWNNKPLRLQVDHIDGDYLNNEQNNVRFLCPNCHSQTDTWGSKNIKTIL